MIANRKFGSIGNLPAIYFQEVIHFLQLRLNRMDHIFPFPMDFGVNRLTGPKNINIPFIN